MTTSHENLADEVGDYAVESWKSWEQGEMSDSQTIKAVKGFVGKLQAYALASGIKPPEAAILELTEEAEIAARDLLHTGIKINSELKKPMHPDTVKRIMRVLDYEQDPTYIIDADTLSQSASG
jgi:hypothetical protein